MTTDHQRPEWATDECVFDMITDLLIYDPFKFREGLNELTRYDLTRKLMKRTTLKKDAEMVINIALESGVIVEHKYGMFRLSEEGKNQLRQQQREQELAEAENDRRSRPNSEISKLRVFMDVFNALCGPDKNDVKTTDFINGLIDTGKFTNGDAWAYLRRATKNGQIYERKTGFYCKA